MALLKSYFDESISHHSSNPRLMVIAGCTMSDMGWIHLVKEWAAILNEFEIRIFRSSDCNASKGEFLGWDGNKKDDLRNRLILALEKSWRGRNLVICPVFSWIAIDVDVFDRVQCEFRGAHITPYELLVYLFVAGQKHAIRKHHDGVHKLKIFFERGQPVGPNVRDYLAETLKIEPRIEEISFVAKEDDLPLQVADMLAYEAHKSQFEGLRRLLVMLIESGVGDSLMMDEQ